MAVVRLNRPDKANAYDGDMLAALERLISEFETARTPAVIFVSSNPHFFCAGADLARVANPTAADALHMASQRVFGLLNRASFVSIAVVEGSAVAGGFEWALACDARIAGPHARFWLPEVRMNLIPSAGGCARLTELVGSARAKQLVLFEDKLDAPTAAAWGVVRAVSAAPFADALKLAGAMTGGGGLARQLAKQVIDHAGGGIDGTLLLERVSEAALYEAKRKPRAMLLGVGTAAPDEQYSQSQVDERPVYCTLHTAYTQFMRYAARHRRGPYAKHVLALAHANAHMHMCTCICTCTCTYACACACTYIGG